MLRDYKKNNSYYETHIIYSLKSFKKDFDKNKKFFINFREKYDKLL